MTADAGAGATSSTRPAGRVIRDFAAASHLELEAGTRAGEFVLVLPGEHKLKTVCSLLVGERDLSISAFVIRHPDEEELRVYRYLLSRNLRLPGLAYAIDGSGDVYVVGRVPLAAVDAAYLDRLLGVVLEATDGCFNELLALGFLSSMRKEWAWRTSRGESLRNLEPFRHLLEPVSLHEQPSSTRNEQVGPADGATPDN